MGEIQRNVGLVDESIDKFKMFKQAYECYKKHTVNMKVLYFIPLVFLHFNFKNLGPKTCVV